LKDLLIEAMREKSQHIEVPEGEELNLAKLVEEY
jgi:hypothetical protein